MAPTVSDPPLKVRAERRQEGRIEVRYATLEVVERLVELEEQVLPVKALLDRALPVLLASTGVSTGALLLYQPEAERLVLAAQQGLSEAGVSALQEIANGGRRGWEIPLHALLNRKAYIIDHMAEHPFVPRLVPVDKLSRVTNMAMAPLYRGSTPTGVIILIADKGRPLEEKHVLSLVLPLSLLAVAIDQERRTGTYKAGPSPEGTSPEPCRPLEVSHLVEASEAKAQKAQVQQEADEVRGEISSLREQLVEVQAELEAERRRSAAASSARERASSSAQEMESEIENLKATAKSAEGACGQMKLRLAALETEREGLERQLNLATGQLTESRTRLGAVEKELCAKRTALAKVLDDFDAVKCELESRRKTASEADAKATAEADSLRSAIAREREERQANAEEAAQVVEQLKKLKAAHVAERERAAGLERELSSLREKELSAHRKVQELTKQLEQQEGKAAESRASAEASIAGKAAEITTLTSRLENERQERQEATRKFELAAKKKQEQLEAAKTREREIADKLSQSQAIRARLEQELEARQAELSQLSLRVSEAETKAREERNTLVTERASREKLAARLSQGEGAAKKIAAELCREVKAEQDRCNKLEASLREAEARCARLSEEIVRERGEKKHQGAKVGAAEKRVAELSELVAKAEKHCQESEVKLRDVQAAAESYKERLTAAIHDLSLKSGEREAAAARLHRELAEQRQQANAVTRELKSLREEANEATRARQQLEEEIAALREKLEGERSVVQRLRQAYSQSEKLRIRTANELSQFEAERRQLAELNAAQGKRLAALDSEAAEARARIATLEENRRRLEDMGRRHQEDGLHWQAALSQLNATLSEARAEAAAKSSEVEKFSKRAVAAERGLRELKGLKEEVEKQAAAERSQREALEAKLKKLTSEYESWARERSGWKLEHEQGPIEISSWSSKRPAHSNEAVGKAPQVGKGEGVAEQEVKGREAIAVIDDDGVPEDAFIQALAEAGIVAAKVERSISESPKPALALVNIIATSLKPLEMMLFITKQCPDTAAVTYLRDPQSNHGFCLGPTACVVATTPGAEIAEAVGSLCRNAKRVLTVSADIDAMIACKRSLAKADYAMSMACDARQGADLLELVRPDVIVLDTRLPEHGAARFVESLRIQAGQTSRGVVLLLPEAEDGVGLNCDDLFRGVSLLEEVSPKSLAEAAVAAEALKRGFSAGPSRSDVQELAAGGGRLAG